MGKKKRRQDEEEAEANGQHADQPPSVANGDESMADIKKDKKKRKKDKGDEEAAAPSAAAEKAEAEPAGPADSSAAEASKLLVSEQDAQYLSEVIEHFKTLVDDEERQLLLGNVMEELQGKEAKVAADPICSRHIEKLLAHASSTQLLQFIRSCLQEDTFTPLVSR